ncbi:hypothetical protein GGH94_003900 [Coemansia aciculifera]|uniref:Uncharacterized protein n=1 Tax=Coemansia aciculifera TaxID=417176 RepID=A0A9W8IGA2_9FUNG|nr:hypothetical protein GGH94_003900 [Coemansia aciculifera]
MNREFQENNAISQRTRELVDFLQESIEKHNIEIDQYETRLEEAFISLDRAQSEHAACMALNPHICTEQDVERVLNQQCDLEQSTAGHDA